jgi:hypothetical protein
MEVELPPVVPVVPAVPAVELVGGVAAVVPLVVPLVVPAVVPELELDPLPIVAFARMNPPLVEAPVVLVEPGLAEPSCRQPVTVIVSLLPVVVLGLWAINATDVTHAIAVVIHKVRFIYPPAAQAASAIPVRRRGRGMMRQWHAPGG